METAREYKTLRQRGTDQHLEFAQKRFFKRTNRYLRQWSRVAYAVSELMCHLVVVFAILASFRGISYVLSRLWGAKGHYFFGRIPAHFIFDGADIAILACFLGYGVYSILRAYIRHE